VDTIGLGGVYLNTLNPLPKGSTIDLIMGLPTGKVRTRATVRRSIPGRGMGLEFVQMLTEARSRLNQFLLQPEAPHKVSAVPPVSNSQAATSMAGLPTDQLLFERELKRLIEVAEKGTYYDLLGVNPASANSEIKKSYYALARTFHPDHHMGKTHLITSLQTLMFVATEAYHALRSECHRASYDKLLAAKGAFNLAREKTESQETGEDWMNRAKECLRARNFVGSIVWLRKCVHVAPDAKSHLLLARSLGTVMAYRPEAVFHFQRAIELDPLNTEAYFHFGELYEAMKLPWRASPLYAQILTIDPEHAGARGHLSAIEANEKRKTS
jgi:tetratricopeptide (TPR) repeat protein